MTEAEMAMEEKLRKKKEEEEAMWAEYIEQMKKTRAKEEEDLRKLKERQARRKEQRAEQEKMMFEMKRKQDEQKQREIEEKKNREAEAKRKRLEEAERKRQAMAQAMQKQKEAVKPNYVISKKEGSTAQGRDQDKFSNVAFARAELNKTKEQLAEEKIIALGLRVKPLKIDNMDEDELRKKAAELWEQIIQLESDKYDLEERRKRQDYDLKELNERQRQINRNKALKKGLDPEAFTGKYPPKINVASKYERRVDRYTFEDKKALFDGGWEELYKQQLEKSWEERIKDYKERGSPKLMRWDPTNPKNKETYEPGTRTYDDTDDFDVMDTFKPYSAPEPSPPKSNPRYEPPQTHEEPDEEEEEDD